LRRREKKEKSLITTPSRRRKLGGTAGKGGSSQKGIERVENATQGNDGVKKKVLRLRKRIRKQTRRRVPSKSSKKLAYHNQSEKNFIGVKGAEGIGVVLAKRGVRVPPT